MWKSLLRIQISVTLNLSTCFHFMHQSETALSMKFIGLKLIFVPLKYIVLIYSSDRSEKLIAWTFIHFNWPFHSIAALWTIWAIKIARTFNLPGAPPAEPYDMPKAFGRVSFPALFHILKLTEFLVKCLAFPLIPRNV